MGKEGGGPRWGTCGRSKEQLPFLDREWSSSAYYSVTVLRMQRESMARRRRQAGWVELLLFRPHVFFSGRKPQDTEYIVFSAILAPVGVFHG
jgi:hypothetical protein